MKIALFALTVFSLISCDRLDLSQKDQEVFFKRVE